MAYKEYFQNSNEVTPAYEQAFRFMFDGHSAIMFLVDPETGSILDANQSAVDFYKYPRLKFCGMTIHDINTFSPDQVEEERQKALKEKRSYLIFPHKLATHEERFVKIYSSPIVLEGNLILFMIIHDITQRKLAEDGLRESEEKYRRLFDNTILGIFQATPEGVVVLVNNAFAHMFGYDSPEDAIADIKNIATDVFSEPTQWTKIMSLMSGSTGLKISENTYHRKDGSEFFGSLNITAIRDSENNLIHVEGIIEDITERKKVEDQLRQLSRAVEYSPVSIMVTDRNGNIEYVNPKFTTMTGYTLEEVHGKSTSILKSGKTTPDAYAALWQTILAGKEWRGEFINRKKNGELYWEDESISPITDSNGNITHFIAVNEDVTARKEAEEKIKHLNAGLEKLAMTDHLTSLNNRRYFMQCGAEEFKRAIRYKTPLTLLMVDIDKFKSINDVYGHKAGDMALQQIAAMLKSCLREIDILGRIGGEEFAVLLPNTPLDEALLLAERVRESIVNTTYEVSDEAESISIKISVSIGLASYAETMLRVDDLLKNADHALYHAKNNGRNCVAKYGE